MSEELKPDEKLTLAEGHLLAKCMHEANRAKGINAVEYWLRQAVKIFDEHTPPEPRS